MRSGTIIFTSGKGGVGKTPLSIAFVLALSKLGKKVVALDYNFHNPDLYEVLGRFGVEEVDVIDKIGEKKLTPPLIISTIKLFGEPVYNVSRIEKYRYAPFTSEQLFRSILAVREFLDIEDIFVIVDTNLNPISLSLINIEGAKVVSKCEKAFDSINLAYLITPPVLSRYISSDKSGEIELLENSVNMLGRYGIKFLGSGGENIIYFFTPTVYDEEKFYSGFMNYLKSRFNRIFGTRKDYVDLSKVVSPKEGLKELLDLSMLSYTRSTWRMDIRKLKELRELFLESLSTAMESSKDFFAKADASDVQTIFFSLLLEKLFDSATKTFPRNVLIIPFIIKALIGFVDTILLVEELSEEHIFRKISPISDYIFEWIKNVYLKGL